MKLPVYYMYMNYTHYQWVYLPLFQEINQTQIKLKNGTGLKLLNVFQLEVFVFVDGFNQNNGCP